jgi:hypothetical protein
MNITILSLRQHILITVADSFLFRSSVPYGEACCPESTKPGLIRSLQLLVTLKKRNEQWTEFHVPPLAMGLDRVSKRWMESLRIGENNMNRKLWSYSLI